MKISKVNWRPLETKYGFSESGNLNFFHKEDNFRCIKIDVTRVTFVESKE
jgi:hypothetical protein